MYSYKYAMQLLDDITTGELITIDKPDDKELRSLRKYISEIGSRYHKRFTTKVRGDKLHIMRVNYYSVNEQLNA